tara:strand:- start:85228 stop:86667 length:1440 start_codon:yes stop_codon:yes gene_type:complete
MTDELTPLWRADEAADATNGKLLPSDAGADWQASGVSIDTRTLNHGDLYTAIKGPNHDGHDHVADAFAKGAAAAMVEHLVEGLGREAKLLQVASTEHGLRALAAAARARTDAKICAITGSVGKTGTKELLAAALGSQGRVTATAGNLNNHYGLPLSLARMPADTDFGVFEMGMNHAGEIAPLSTLAKPHVAMITNVEAVHIEYFESIEGIAAAKAEIFTGLEPDGVAVISRDSPFFDYLSAKAKDAGAKMVWGFGVHSFSNARLLAFEPDAEGARVEATVGSQHIKYRLSMPGKHWALNSVGVLAAAQSMGADLQKTAEALKSVKPPKGRGQMLAIRVDEGLLTVIDETYNASPVAMRAAFNVLAAHKPGRGGRRIVVLGDMLELGDDSEREHSALADDIQAHDFDQVFVCGQYMSDILSALPQDMQGARAATSQQLAAKLADKVRSGDLVMVKGSAGSHMGYVIEALKALGPLETGSA